MEPTVMEDEDGILSDFMTVLTDLMKMDENTHIIIMDGELDVWSKKPVDEFGPSLMSREALEIMVEHGWRFEDQGLSRDFIFDL